MLHPETNFAKRKRRILHPGLVEHAKALGVSLNHLHLVLMGYRKSPPLLARYEALTGKPHVFPAPCPPMPDTCYPPHALPLPVAPHNETPKGITT